MTDSEAAPPAAGRVYISAGSNIEPARHLRAALDELKRSFGALRLSSVYRTTAVGFDGDDFLNLVIACTTPLPVADVLDELDRIESATGRQRNARFAPRTLDLDLLMYDDAVVDSPELTLPRPDILKYAFVLGPLAELAPDLVHPLEGSSMRELWERFDAAGQSIKRQPAALDPS